jgi:hypothetical protein
MSDYEAENVERLNKFLMKYADELEQKADGVKAQSFADKLIKKARLVRMQTIPTWPKMY